MAWGYVHLQHILISLISHIGQTKILLPQTLSSGASTVVSNVLGFLTNYKLLGKQRFFAYHELLSHYIFGELHHMTFYSLK